MAIFKPPQGTTQERSNIILEKGELMFDTTNNTFYTGNDTPGGKAITETTIAIAGSETVNNTETASFEETAESTPQARSYLFKYPRPNSSFIQPTSVTTAANIAVPSNESDVIPFFKTGEDGGIELAIKKQDATVETISGEKIQLAICTGVSSGTPQTCSVRAVKCAADGTTSWSGNTISGVFCTWEAPATE